MAFDPSFAELLKKQQKFLDELDKRLHLTALKAVKNAAEGALSGMRQVSADKWNRAVMLGATAYAGKSGKDAGKAFAKAFEKQSSSTMKSTSQIIAAISDIEERALAMSKKMAGGFSEAAQAAYMVSIAEKEIGSQMKLNSDLMDAQKNALAKSKTDMGAKLAAAQPTPGMSDDEKAAVLKLQSDIIKKSTQEQILIKQKILLLEETDKHLKETLDTAKGIPASLQKLHAQEKVMQFRDKIMAPIDKAKDTVSVMKELFKGGMGGTLGIGIGAVIMAMVMALFKKMGEQYNEFRGKGYYGEQIGRAAKESSDLRGRMLLRGISIDAKTSYEVVEQLNSKLGTLTVPKKLEDSTAILQNRFKLTTEEAAKLNVLLYRANKYDANKAAKAMEDISDVALKFNVNAADLVRTINENSESFYNAARNGAGEFAKAAAHANQIGVSLSSVNRLANNLVDDFEGALQTQAKMATMFPGSDMTEVMYAAQFGSTDDMLNATQSMIQNIGMDINNMPRSFKNALSSMTGFSVEELTNLANGKKLDDAGAKPVSKDDLQNNLKDLVHNPLQKMMEVLDAALQKIAGTLEVLLEQVVHFSTSFVGRLLGVGGNTPESDGRAEARAAAQARKQAGLSAIATMPTYAPPAIAWQMHTGGIVGQHGTPRHTSFSHFLNAPRLHNGLMPDEFPAILQRGEAVIPKTKMPLGMTTMDDFDDDSFNTESSRFENTKQGNVNPTVVVDTAELERLLKQLIAVTKGQKTINMDGKKVGQVLIDAHSRQ